MATRRINTTEKTHLDQDETKAELKSNITPAVPSSVIAKLLGFTFAMITLPIGSYFVTVNTIFGGPFSKTIPGGNRLTWPGNSTYAGGFAALMANVVLIGYVIVAFNDDKMEREEAAQEEKKKSR